MAGIVNKVYSEKNGHSNDLARARFDVNWRQQRNENITARITVKQNDGCEKETCAFCFINRGGKQYGSRDIRTEKICELSVFESRFAFVLCAIALQTA